jgi:hypothetical protein
MLSRLWSLWSGMIGWHILLKQKWLVLRMVIMGMMCSWFAVGPLSSFSVTFIGNWLAYITSIGWREILLRKILVISMLGNKLCKNMLSSSYLFPNWGKIFIHPYLLHTYARLLKVVGNWAYTLCKWCSKCWLVSRVLFLGCKIRRDWLWLVYLWREPPSLA